MMKKVLFLITTLQSGGAEKTLSDTVNNLDPGKYQITVQTLFDKGLYREKLSGHVRYKSIVRFRNKWLRMIAGKLLFFYLPRALVYRLFVRDGYDYEIAFMEGLPTKLLSGSTSKNAKKIAWVHTDLIRNPESARAYPSETAEKAAYERFDRVFCVSNEAERAFVEKYHPVRPETGTLYNIVDDAAITAAAGEAAVLPTGIRPCLISVGRLVWQKGYDRLLRIHKRLIDEGGHHALLIIGDGEMRPRLEAYIRANGLQDTVFLMGFQENPYRYIRRADLFVCASYAEGFGNVITESVLCGTPVIAADVAGIREPVQSPRCSMVVPNEEDALYEALDRIVRHPEKLADFRRELPALQAFFRTEHLLELFETSVFD